MRIVGRVTQALAQRRERRGELGRVRRPIAAHRLRKRRLPPAAREPHGELALHDAPRLAYLARVEADEIGRLAGEPQQHRLARPPQLLGLVGEPREMRVPVDRGRAPRFREIGHHAPPNTSTSANTHAGDAWPTRTICAGSPLPQYGVPYTPKVLASPTARRLRQKLAEMPR
ncbi:Uncharacterised protein [Burkholderia pseudomallei]|nr:Uncharacterised protein [Burkholderia pseudomallei]VBE21888.1 Uncharacterised protein [Burkholderia pseudomallei]VBE83804.1 Uncharacterised protein [Burkholderia pseudomallei]VBH75863.1 Uncharacterised protein [Burkholderia pseudomallei]VBI89608.1 Uncharacterised protein [Burkholderia pseudomallei]